MNYCIALAAGALTNLVMTFASLSLHLNIQYPYLVLLAAFVVTEVVMFRARQMRNKKVPVSVLAWTFSLEAIVFAIGAAAAFLCLVSIYRPNWAWP